MADALLVSSSFLPGRGGIESYLGELCAALSPRVAVIAAGTRDGVPLPTGLGYPTHPFAGRMLWPGRAALDAIVKTAAEEGTDRIVFGTPWPLVLLGPRLRSAGLRYSVIIHGAELIVPAAVPGLRSRVGTALAQADMLLPVSDYTRDKTESFLGRSNLPVPPLHLLRARIDLDRFHPDIDVDTLRGRLGLEAGQQTLLCFGRLVPRKGVDRLIEALPDIRQQVPGVVLLVAGTGPEETNLRKLAHKVGEPVIFGGRIPDEETPAWYALADVFVLPVVDRWFGLEIEGLGVVLLEAAACETPQVTGRSGGTPEAVLDGQTGYVIDAKDRTELVGRVTTLLKDPVTAAAMGAAGREHVRANFSDSSIPDEFEAWLAGKEG